MNAAGRQEPGRHLILYDGICGLCNWWIQQIIPRDPAGLFQFATLQGEPGRSLVARYGRNPDALDTVYVLAEHKSKSPKILVRARAALFVIGRLDSPWRFLRIFAVLPTFILDAIYSLIARNRYRLFGRYDRCPIPSADQASRFIDV
jgi:predicted DCC family thiol-disulfide oxidoreductase YuxK